MALKPERLEAKKLYVESLFTVETIEKVLSKKVSRKTLYNWKKNVDGLDEADWDTLRKNKFSEAEDMKDLLKKIIKSLGREILADPSNHNLHFAMPKYLVGLRYYEDFENLFKEMSEEEKQSGKKEFDQDMMKKIVNAVDDHLRGK
jgi:hypothetical protein